MREMRNLWQETNEKLTENSKSFNDVVAICGNDFQITKKEFENDRNKQAGFHLKAYKGI